MLAVATLFGDSVLVVAMMAAHPVLFKVQGHAGIATFALAAPTAARAVDDLTVAATIEKQQYLLFLVEVFMYGLNQVSAEAILYSRMRGINRSDSG